MSWINRRPAKKAVSENDRINDTFIKDSNVEILITNGNSQMPGKKSKKANYLSLIVAVTIMFAIMAYAIMIKLGLSRPL